MPRRWLTFRRQHSLQRAPTDGRSGERAGLYVEFSNKALQDRYSQHREAAQAGREYFTKSKAAQGGQQPERDQQAQKPDHDRGH